jgi:hypothetical protein
MSLARKGLLELAESADPTDHKNALYARDVAGMCAEVRRGHDVVERLGWPD